jgi:DNA-binding transcriptional ArsR family regulator
VPQSVEARLALLKCIADETRFKILITLKDGERCVCDIIKELEVEQSLISHHLRALRRCGLVKSVREGRKIRYKLVDQSIAELLANVGKVSSRLSKCAIA